MVGRSRPGINNYYTWERKPYLANIEMARNEFIKGFRNTPFAFFDQYLVRFFLQEIVSHNNHVISYKIFFKIIPNIGQNRQKWPPGCLES